MRRICQICIVDALIGGGGVHMENPKSILKFLNLCYEYDVV